MVQIISLANPTTIGEVQTFEQELNVELPKDYREFLLVYNCAKVNPNCFLLNYEKGYKETYNEVRYLFGLSDLNWCNLRDYQRDYADRMPDNLLPIGTDEDSSYICLSIKGNDFG